jgi:hypothetical protein
MICIFTAEPSDATSHKSRLNNSPTKFVGNREFT